MTSPGKLELRDLVNVSTTPFVVIIIVIIVVIVAQLVNALCAVGAAHCKILAVGKTMHVRKMADMLQHNRFTM